VRVTVTALPGADVPASTSVVSRVSRSVVEAPVSSLTETTTGAARVVSTTYGSEAGPRLPAASEVTAVNVWVPGERGGPGDTTVQSPPSSVMARPRLPLPARVTSTSPPGSPVPLTTTAPPSSTTLVMAGAAGAVRSTFTRRAAAGDPGPVSGSVPAAVNAWNPSARVMPL
jgi:hypothetical protein